MCPRKETKKERYKKLRGRLIERREGVQTNRTL